MASPGAPGGIQCGEVGSPLDRVTLPGQMLQCADVAAEAEPPEFAFRQLVGCTFAQALAMRLCRRNRRRRDRRFILRPQVAVAITVAGLARPALAPLARHRCPP